ncbi:MAG: fimbrillin family protein, partial [Bacteroidales bacterium]
LFDSTTGLEKDGNTFGVWGYYVSGEEFTTGAENVFASTPITVTRTNDVWGYGEAAKWIPNKNYRFYAYAPASLGADVTVGSSVGDNQVTIENFKVVGTTDNGVMAYAPARHIDALVAHRYDRDIRTAFDNSKIGLTFKHILTNVNLKFNTTSKYEIELTKVQLKGVNTKGDATVTPDVVGAEVDPMVITWANQAVPLAFAGALNTDPIVSGGEGENNINVVGESFASMENMLMIPQNFEAKALVLDIEYTVGGKGEDGDATFKREVQLSNGQNSTNSWVAGTRITYVITINTANGDNGNSYDIVFGVTTTPDFIDGTNGTGSAK